MITAFSDRRSEVTTDHILNAVKATTPLSESSKDQFDLLREQATKSKWRPATSVTSAEARHEGRKLRATREPVR